MGLTAKQEGFAQDVAAGSTLTDAYRANYNTQTPRVETVMDSAHKVAKNPEVAQRVAEHVERAFDGENIKDYVLKNLRKQVDNGKNEGATQQALKLLGMTQGMYRDVVETSERTLSNAELISQLAEDNEPLAAMLREQLGVED